MIWRAMAIAAIAAVLAGCDEESYDHAPPPGMGAIVIDNESWTDFDVFVEGVYQARVSDGNTAVFDLQPGIHRLVLDGEDHSDFYGDTHSGDFADDVDVLEGRLTVVQITSNYGYPYESLQYWVHFE